MRRLATLTVATAVVVPLGFAGTAKAQVSYSFDGDLIGYWSLDDEVDPTNDDSGGGHDGTLGANPGTGGTSGADETDDPVYDGVNKPALITNAFSLDFTVADGDFVNVGAISVGSGNFTAAACVKTTQSDSNFRNVIIAFPALPAPSSFNSDAGWALQVKDDKAQATLSDGTNRTDVVGTSTVTDGIFHGLALVRDGNTMRVYVDGTEEITGDITGMGNVDNSPNEVFISFDDPNITTGVAAFDGNIDEVRIYDVALSPAEIGQLCANGTLVIADPTDDAPDNIDIASVEISEDGTDLTCVFNLDETGTGGLLNKSTFRCHIDFDDEENSDFAGKGCDLAADTAYRLGTNSLCTTSDLTMTYRPTKRGGFCTGLPNIICVEEETNGDGDTDALCDGTVNSKDAVSCKITITGDLADIATVWDAQCDGESECLTTITDRTNDGEFDVFMFFDSQLKSDRDRVPDTDDNNKPNVLGEVVDVTLPDGS